MTTIDPPPYRVFLNYITQNIPAIVISVLYVIAGGVVACSIYPDDPLNGGWWIWGWLITLPVNLISFSFRYTGDIGYSGVIFIQCIMLIPTFLLASLITKRLKK